jgi:hypothetical protein
VEYVRNEKLKKTSFAECCRLIYDTGRVTIVYSKLAINTKPLKTERLKKDSVAEDPNLLGCNAVNCLTLKMSRTTILQNISNYLPVNRK